MPLADDLMYLFHIRPEAPGAVFAREDYPRLLRERLAQYGSYVADIRASLDDNSDIVYSPIEPMMLPWPWFRGRVVIGGDAAHVFPPHLTQGAAMAAEDAYVLVNEVLNENAPIESRLMSYSQEALCALRVRLHIFPAMDGRRAVGPHRGGPRTGAGGDGAQCIGTDCGQRSHPQHSGDLTRVLINPLTECPFLGRSGGGR